MAAGRAAGSADAHSPNSDPHKPNPFQNLRDIARGERTFRDDTDNLALYQVRKRQQRRVWRGSGERICAGGCSATPRPASPCSLNALHIWLTLPPPISSALQSEISRRPKVARILSNLIRFNGQAGRHRLA